MIPMYRSKVTNSNTLPSFGGDERILSIVLSSTELAELDLSKLQLFQTSSAAGDPNEAEPVVYKTKGAIEAEKSVEVSEKKEASMDQKGYDRRPRSSAMQKISRKSEKDPPPSVDPNSKEENVKIGIDLKSSPASKFLVPWELQPSPIMPFTPVAVPFQWEEAPGKPKERATDKFDRRSPRPQALHLPPRLLLSRRTTNPQSPPDEADALHQRSGSAGSAEEKRVICVQETEKHQEDRSPGRLVPSLECQLVCYSPLRALGPPPPEDLHWIAKASALITMWRKNSSAKHKFKQSPNNNDNMKSTSAKVFYQSDDHLIEGRQEDLWMKESPKTRSRAQALNAVIAVAMGAKTKDFNSCNEMTPSHPRGHKSLDLITGSDAYCSNLVDKKTRKKRKWVLRKLRRPVRVFKTFFGAVWKAMRLGKSRHRSRGNRRLSYKSLRR